MQTQGIGHQQFFLQPATFVQRRYEVLHAVVVDEQPLPEVATRYQVSYGTVRSWLSEFRAQCDQGQPPPFFLQPSRGRPARAG